MINILTITKQWLMEISDDIINSCQGKNHLYSTPYSRYNAYLNNICLKTFLPWFQENYTSLATSWEKEKDYPNMWEFINGSIIRLGDKKILLLPTENIDHDEIRIPQEWVDIPDAVADYYLAVQVYLEEKYMTIWGYTTHHQIKNKAQYDSFNRTYSLDKEDINHDLNIFWLTHELSIPETTREIVTPLQIISDTQRDNLIHRLGNPDIIFPRIAIPFSLWGVLWSNDKSRRQIYQQRLGKPQSVNLKSWLRGKMEDNWQLWSELFSSGKPALAFNFRKSSLDSKSHIMGVKSIPLPSLDKKENEEVLLLVEIGEESLEKMTIQVRLYPQPYHYHLPPKIKLELFIDSETCLKSVESRYQDNYISLPRFKCDNDNLFQFMIKISLDKTEIREYFTV